MQVLIDEARRSDVHALIAGIVTDNTRSLRLHVSLGFIEVAHLREVGYKFGQCLNLKFLELVLGTPARQNET